MQPYSRTGPKVLSLLAALAASLHAPSALAEAVARPSPPIAGQMCATDAERLASAVFSLQASAAFAGAGCVRPGSSATLAQGHFAVSPRSAPLSAPPSAPLSAARTSGQAPAPADVETFAPPLATAIDLAPSDHIAPAQLSSPARDGAALAAYRGQGPISTYGHEDAPVGLKFGLPF
jgi:hypothetical protein